VNTVAMFVNMDLVNTVTSPVSTDLASTVIMTLASTGLAQTRVLQPVSTVLASTDLALTLASTVPANTHLVLLHRNNRERHNQTVNSPAVIASIHSSVVARSHHYTLVVVEDILLALHQCMVADRPVVAVSTVAESVPLDYEWVGHGFDHVVATSLVIVPTR
jgi:hypothetical protein